MFEESEKQFKKLMNIETGLTEEREEYVARKTGVNLNMVKRIFEVESEYASLVLKKKGKVNLLGRCVLELQKKDNGKIHIKAKAPKRLYRLMEKNIEDDVSEKDLGVVLKKITYFD